MLVIGPLDLGAHREALGERRPGVVLELLDAERDALVLDVDAEDHGLDLVALLVGLGRVLDLLRPVRVRDVDQTVDAVIDADGNAEVGDALDLARDRLPVG